MKITSLTLKNYRCFKNVVIELHPSFNIIVGVNGMGKTAILEALKVAIGSLFLRFDKHDDHLASPSILRDDVRLAHLEPQYPVLITATGELAKEDISWTRSLETSRGRTRSNEAKEMQRLSQRMQKNIKETDVVSDIPLIAYYSTERFKKEKRDVGVVPDGSRLRGYYHALDAQTNLKFFLGIWKTETYAQIQRGEESSLLQNVKHAVKTCIQDCEDIYFDVKADTLLMKMGKTGELLPFHILSDGVRSMLAMVMEIAFRCHLLNPHLGRDAALQSSGVVLIDEIDLHLHPSWQTRVIRDLRQAFPHIQFIVSTHAPLVLGAMSEGVIHYLDVGGQVGIMPLQKGYDANYILNEMGAAEMDPKLKEMIKKYLLLVKSGQGQVPESLDLRARLESEIGKHHTVLERADQIMRFF